MGVQLNIKDAVAVELARRLAEDLRTSVTAVNRSALEEKLARLDADRQRGAPDVDAAMALFEGLRDRWKPEYRDIEMSTRHGEFLYVEAGLLFKGEDFVHTDVTPALPAA